MAKEESYVKISRIETKKSTMLGVQIENLRPMEVISLLELAKDSILQEMKKNTKISTTDDRGGYDRTVQKLKDVDDID